MNQPARSKSGSESWKRASAILLVAVMVAMIANPVLASSMSNDTGTTGQPEGASRILSATAPGQSSDANIQDHDINHGANVALSHYPEAYDTANPFRDKSAIPPGSDGSLPMSAPEPTPQDTGGPDVWGYEWVDSNAPGPSISYSWNDISGTGINSGLSGDDQTVNIPVGFDFEFYGYTYSDVNVCTNGFLQLGGADTQYWTNNIPSPKGPDNIICPFWNDLWNPGNPTSALYYETSGVAPDRELVIQFNDWDYLDSGGGMYFQVILTESGDIWFLYNTIWSAGWYPDVVGIENGDGSDGLAYPNPVSNGLAIKFFRPNYPFRALQGPEFSNSFGSPGAEVDYPMKIENIGANPDTYDLSAAGNAWPVTFWSSQTRTFVDEDFESGVPPMGWTAIDYTGWGDPIGNWHGNDYGGNPNWAGSGLCAEANSSLLSSWWTGTGGVSAGLDTPHFDLSGPYVSATLEFDMSYVDENWGTDDYASVWVNHGGVWDLVSFYDEDHGAFGPGEYVTIDLSPYIGESDVYVEFYYYDNWIWADWWQIDNVRIYADTGIPPAPINSIGPLGPGETGFFTARVSIPPGAGPGDTDLVGITATSNGNSGIQTAAGVLTQVPYDGGIVEDFDGNILPGGFADVISQGTPPTNWEVGDPAGWGPGTAFSGSNCAGTNIDNWYYPGADIVLTTPYVALAGSGNNTLSFQNWYVMDTWGDDGGFVEISINGGPWMLIAPNGGYPYTSAWMGGYMTDGYTGASGGWQAAEFDLTAFSGQVVRARFHFAASPWWGGQDGWYVDDIQLGLPPYQYNATPPNQIGLGWIGDYVDHPITIQNLGGQPDTYRLFSERGMFVWPTEIWDADNTEELSHSPLLQPGDSWTFHARVRIPRGVSPGDFDIGTIGIESVGSGEQQFVNVQTQTSLFAPFYDNFESGVFGLGPYTTEDWTSDIPEGEESNADIGNQTSESPTHSMFTNGGVVSVTSAPIYLENVQNPIVSFWLQRGDDTFSENPDYGEDLVVEYYNMHHRWVELERFPGDGIPGEIFHRGYALPDARCPDFRLRFTQTDGSGAPYDYWHIDDVYIGAPDPNFFVTPASDKKVDAAGALVQYELTVHNQAIHSDMFRAQVQNNDWPTLVHLPVFQDDFNDEDMSGWSVVDEGWTDGPPSDWYVDGAGILRQADNIYTYTGQWFPGTFAWSGDTSWTDYVYKADIRSTDNDGIGLMARYTDPNNYYRFHWSNDPVWDKDWTNPGLQRRVLDVNVGGTWTVLASDDVPYTTSQWYEVEMKLIGSHIQIYIDGSLIFDVIDGSLDHGAVGLYSWGNTGAFFDNVKVYGPGGTLGPVPPGGTDTFIVTVEIPPGEDYGAADEADIIVSSQFAPWATDTSQITTGVRAVLNVDRNIWYLTIQDAVDDANTGEHLWAYPATYNEKVLVDRPLTITGVDRDTTIVDGSITITGPKVLLVFSDNGGGEPLASQLMALGGIGTVDTFDARNGTPTLALLQNYQVVVTWSDYNYNDAVALGDVLADYVDAGGCLIMAAFNWYSSTGSFSMAGRIVTDGYTPLLSDDAGAHYSTSALGAYDASHPIMRGITTAGDYYRNYVHLSAGADLVASWADGEEFVAMKGNVVGINSYPGFYSRWTGQVDQIFHNAIMALMGNLPLVKMNANDVTFKNFTLRNGRTGIDLRGANGCTIENNTMSDCDSGIVAVGAGGNTIQNNLIVGLADAGIRVSGPADFTVDDDFSADTGRWTYYGSASRTGGYCELTPAANGQLGRILYDTPVRSAFVAEFDYLAGGGSGADGLALNIFKEDYVPVGGGRLGAVDSDGTTLGYSVEFDNYQNSGDPNANHIAITKDTVNNHLAYVPDGRTEDNAWHHVKVIATGSGIQVFVDDMANPLLDWHGAVDMTYGGLSFSAATGGLNNNHWVDNIRITPLGNAIRDNVVRDNGRAIILEGTQNNLIYHNDIIGNGIQAADDGADANAWDNGYPDGGNYWSDYSGPDAFSGPLQNIPGGDGMGDVPYDIDPDSADNYPLMRQHVAWATTWADDFQDGDISDWTINSIGGGDAGIGNYASDQGASSAPYSLYTRWDPVEALTPTIPLGGQTEVSVYYWVQRGDDAWSEDPDGGEDLVVEYYTDSGTWSTLDTFPGAGTPGEIFRAWHNLPADALHDNFRLRFTQTGGSGSDYDYWHIDDIAIYDGSVVEMVTASLPPVHSVDTLDDPAPSTGITGTVGGQQAASVPAGILEPAPAGDGPENALDTGPAMIDDGTSGQEDAAPLPAAEPTPTHALQELTAQEPADDEANTAVTAAGGNDTAAQASAFPPLWPLMLLALLAAAGMLAYRRYQRYRRNRGTRKA